MTMLIWKSESQTAVTTQLRFSRSTSRTFAESISLHYCYGSPISWVQNWLPMGAIVCQWPCLCSWITWWAESKIKELEGWTGREGTQGKRWEDQDKSCALYTTSWKWRLHLSNSHVVYVWKALESIQSSKLSKLCTQV